MTERRRDLAPLAVFVAAALFFCAGATSRDLWTTGEHRYAEVARVLVAAGHDHVVPHLNGEVYPDKPPLFFWFAGAGHAFLGLDLALSAKLPSILGGAFTVMLTFLLGRRWFGPAAGFAAAAVLATTDLFDWASRYAHMDAFLTTVITSVMYCFVRAVETPPEQRAARNAWSALGFLAVGAGILVKGPPAPLIPGATILAWLLWTNPRGLLTPKLAWGALLAVLPGLVWCAFVLDDLGTDAGMHYLDGLVRGQAIGHAAGEIDKLQPWNYYLWNVPVHLLPWFLFVPAAVLAALARGRPGEERVDRLLVAWLFASWVVFSFAKAKRDLYMVPLHPAAALLVARLFRDVRDAPERLREPLLFVPWRLMVMAAVVLGGAVVLAAALLLTDGDRAILGSVVTAGTPRLVAWRDRYELLRAEFPGGSLLAAASLGTLMLWAGLVSLRARTVVRAGGGLVAATAAWILLNAVVVSPSRDSDVSPRAFLEKARQHIGNAPLARLGGDGGLQYAVNWVLERDEVTEIPVSKQDGRLPAEEIARRAARFLDGESPRFLVTDVDQLWGVGTPPGATEILRVDRRRSPDLVLFGNAAAAEAR